MNWVLFLQIEVILLTVGLVAAFVVSHTQYVKDRSWSTRIGAFGESLKAIGKDISEKRSDDASKAMNELIKALKQKTEENK